MKVTNISLPILGTNCYIVLNEKTNECLIIDPGSGASIIADKIKAIGGKPVGILLTHGHFDHAGDAKAVSQMYNIPVYASKLEENTLDNSKFNLSGMFYGETSSYHADVLLKDNEEFDLAGFHIRMLSTPGHTEGGCCYYFSYFGVVFSGDTLFCGAVGRTDFPGGSMSVLIKSVKEKLLTLPEDTVVYPGHDSATTIESERINNPYIA